MLLFYLVELINQEQSMHSLEYALEENDLSSAKYSLYMHDFFRKYLYREFLQPTKNC